MSAAFHPFPVPMPESMQSFIVENAARLVMECGASLEDAVIDAVGFAVSGEAWEPYIGEYTAIPEMMPREGEFRSETDKQAAIRAVASLLHNAELVEKVMEEIYPNKRVRRAASTNAWQRLRDALADPTREARVTAIYDLSSEKSRMQEELASCKQMLRRLLPSADIKQLLEEVSADSAYPSPEVYQAIIDECT